MAQQTIGIGSSANDGTGDTLRTAGGKINDNFTELYAGLGGPSRMTAVAISADTTLTAASHNNKSIEVTTAASDITLTLPASGNTDGDEMIVLKADRSAGRVKFATLAGAVNMVWLREQYSWIRLHYSANLGWFPIAQSDEYAAFKTGMRYPADCTAFGTATFPTANRIFFSAIVVRKLTTVAGLEALVTGAGNAGSYAVLGLYTSKNGQPDALIAQTPYASSQISTAATGVAGADFVGGNVTIPPGLYWIAVAHSFSATATFARQTGARSLQAFIGNTDASVLLGASDSSSYFNNGFTAGSSLPNPAGAVTAIGPGITAVLKAA